MGGSDEAPNLRVAIVGGGIGGVLLAIGFQKHIHIDAQLYESAPSFGEIGAGVSIGPNAQRALQLIDPRARAVLDKLSSTNLWESHMHDFVVNRCVSHTADIPANEEEHEKGSNMTREKADRAIPGVWPACRRGHLHAKDTGAYPDRAPRAAA